MPRRSQSRRRGDYVDDDDRSDVSQPPLWFSLLVRHPRDCLIGLVLFAALAAIIVNSLFLQPGPHPAPIFAVKPSGVHEATGAVVLPRPRPAEVESIRRDVPVAPARPRTDVISPAHGKTASLAPSGNAGAGTSATATATATAIAPKTAAPRGETTSDKGAPNGAKVLAVQRALTDFGYGQFKPSGQYDAETRAAIERFERERQLPITGQVSDRLVRELAGMTGRPLD